MEWTSENMAANAALVRERIARACARAGRDPASVALVWVSKTKPAEAVRAAYGAGARDFGENRVQELVEKFSDPLPGVVRHLIGPLQSNKARKAVRCADVIHSVASLDLVRRLGQLAEEENRTLRLLFQVNCSGEGTKSGLAPEEVEPFLRTLPETPRLLYSGLMTIGPNTGNPEDARLPFRRLRSWRDAFFGTDGRFARFSELSMGMSEDLEVAIEEGATWVRVGTALFGARDYGAPATKE
jgi:hypothetical protein